MSTGDMKSLRAGSLSERGHNRGGVNGIGVGAVIYTIPLAPKGRPEGNTEFLEVMMTRYRGHFFVLRICLGPVFGSVDDYVPSLHGGQKLAARCIGKAFLLLRPTRALYLSRASTSSHHMVLYRNGVGAGLYTGDDGLRISQSRQFQGGGGKEGFASQIQARQSINQSIN